MDGTGIPPHSHATLTGYTAATSVGLHDHELVARELSSFIPGPEPANAILLACSIYYRATMSPGTHARHRVMSLLDLHGEWTNAARTDGGVR